MLRAIINALRNAASRVFGWIDDIISIPFNFFRPSGNAGGTNPYAEADASDEISDIEEDLRAQRVRDELAPKAEAVRNAAAQTVGSAVHEYARSLPADRARVDLSPLSSQQAAWLMSRDETQLEELAIGGPAMCARLARHANVHMATYAEPVDQTNVASFSERVAAIAVRSRKIDSEEEPVIDRRGAPIYRPRFG